MLDLRHRRYMFLNKNVKKTVTLTDKINITDKARESICNQGIDKYLFIGAFYIVLEVQYGY